MKTRFCLCVSGCFLVSLICTIQPSVAVDELDTWAETLVAGRPPVPPGLDQDRPAAEAETAPAIVGKLAEQYTVFAEAEVLAHPPSLAQGTGDSQVWTVQMGGGALPAHRFAAHLRPDDFRPLYWHASGLPSVPQPTFAQASALVLDTLLGSKQAGRLVTGLPTPVDAADARLRNWRGKLAPPWDRYWLFFIDDEPGANWAHPCRYVFLAPDLSAFAIRYGQTPLTFEWVKQGKAYPQELSTVLPYDFQSDPPEPRPGAVEGAPGGATALDYAGSAEGCYAVIISGGYNAYNNRPRYWGDTAFTYCTLVQKYGYTDSRIYVCMSDGTDSGADQNIGPENTPAVYVDSETDLDNDGDVDVDRACTYADVEAVFTELDGILTADDQLFVFVTDHGDRSSGSDATICLWDQEELRDDELRDMTDHFPCPVIFAMETCYSGGFVDDIEADPDRVICTACDFDETSVAGDTWPDYDIWAQDFMSALRGFYPGDDPWEDGVVCDADADGDNKVSFEEAWDHAFAERDERDDPQYGSNPAGLGNSLFLNQQYTRLINENVVRHMTIPKRFRFEVKDYDWCGIGIHSLTANHNLRCADNPDMDSPYQTSYFGSTIRDFVVVNGHDWGDDVHYAEVYDNVPSSYDIEAEWEADDLIVGTGLPRVMASGEVLEMFEVDLTAGEEYDVSVDITSGSCDASLFVYTPSRSSGRRGSYDWRSSNAGAGGDELVRFFAEDDGWHGIAVLNENASASDFTVLVRETIPLPGPSGVSATDGTHTDRITVSWGSTTGATHYRVFRGTSAASASASPITGWIASFSFEDYGVDPGDVYYYWVKAAAGSDGSRESAFGTPDTGYVLPPTLSSDVAVTASEDPSYYRFRGRSDRWWAAGVRYNQAGENWSLRMCSDASFTTLLKSSAYAEPVDFVVGDGHNVPYQYRGLEAYRFGGTHDATVEFEGSLETLSTGTNVTYGWTAGDVVEIFDAHLAPGTYRFDLDLTLGTADLDFAIFGSQDANYYKNREEYLARSESGGGGQDETFIYTVVAEDDFGICLWANDANSAQYRVIITEVEGGLWEGDVSEDWHTAGNWTGALVPGSTDEVIIPPGTPHSPRIYQGNASCDDLLVESGASLEIANRDLSAGGDVKIHGALNITDPVGDLFADGAVIWESGSTATMVPNAQIHLDGNWQFNLGANVQLTAGTVVFEGTGVSWIRCYEANCHFHDLWSDKDSGGSALLSDRSTAPLRMHNASVFAGSKLGSSVSETPAFVIGGFLRNYYGGNFNFRTGTVVFNGNPASSDLEPGSDSYFNNLEIDTTAPLVLDGTQTNGLVVDGHVNILGGSLDSEGLGIRVGGSWSNNVGHAGFAAGTGTVEFFGTTDQDVVGETVFHRVVNDKTTGTLAFRDPTQVQEDFVGGSVNTIYAPLTVAGLLDLDNSTDGFYLRSGAVVTCGQLDMGGHISSRTGSTFSANDVADSGGIFGTIDVQGGVVNLTQQMSGGVTEYLDLNADLTMTDGEFNLYGGSSYCRVSQGGDASITMSGGTFDVKDRAIWIMDTGHSFTENISGGIIRTAGDFDCRRGTFTPTGGRIEFVGTGSYDFELATGSHVHDVLINRSGQLDAMTDLLIQGDFHLAAGTFTAPARMTVLGDWRNDAGPAAFVEGTGEVVFSGLVSADILTDETFYDFTLNKGSFGRPPWLFLEEGYTLQAVHDVDIRGGTLELNQGTTLDVGHDLSIALDAGLNADDKGQPITINVSGDWSDANPGYSDSTGFDAGFNSTVTFDGKGDSVLTAAAAQERFYHLVIDKLLGSFLPDSPVLVDGDLRIASGTWSYGTADLPHVFRGDFTIETSGLWQDHTAGGAARFEGGGIQSFTDRSHGHLGNVVVAKTPIDLHLPIRPLTLETDLRSLIGGAVTVDSGSFALNGFDCVCDGDVTVHAGAYLRVDPGSSLQVGPGKELVVNGKGLLDLLGTRSRPAIVENQAHGNHAFRVMADGTLGAEHAVIADVDAAGLVVQDGANIDPRRPLNYCSFTRPPSGGTLLQVENDQILEIVGADFPDKPALSGYNVGKSLKQGHLTFIASTGSFAGEGYDNDPFDRIDWHSGGLTKVTISGPAAATMGGQYTFEADAVGDMPLMPLTYTWTVTDAPDVVHTLSGLHDVTGCSWDTIGSKLIQIRVTNEVSSVQDTYPLSIAELVISGILTETVLGTNQCVLTLSGTSADSRYGIEFRTNIVEGAWAPAAPDGTDVPGEDGQCEWTDTGGPDRDLDSLHELYYRAVLK